MDPVPTITSTPAIVYTPATTAVYGLVNSNQYQSSAQIENEPISSFHFLKMQGPLPDAVIDTQATYDITSLSPGHFLLSPTNDYLHSQTVTSQSDVETAQFRQLYAIERQLRKVKKQSRRRRTIVGITNEISTGNVGDGGTKEGSTNMKQVENSRISK